MKDVIDFTDIFADDEMVKLWLDHFNSEHPSMTSDEVSREIEEMENNVKNELIWAAGSSGETAEEHHRNIANIRKYIAELKNILKYDVVLLEKEGESGLTREEVLKLYDKLADTEAYPVEYYNLTGASSAMGFFSRRAAGKIDFYTETNMPIGLFIGKILSDMDLENTNSEYEFDGIKIFLDRNI